MMANPTLELHDPITYKNYTIHISITIMQIIINRKLCTNESFKSYVNT